MKYIILKKLSEIVYRLLRAYNSIEIRSLLKRGLLEVGKHTYDIKNIKIHNYFGSINKVSIGNYCSIGPNLTLITGGYHPINWVSTYPFRVKWDLQEKFRDGMPYSKGSIVIENDVWIGTGVTILSGVKICNGSVIASGAMVTKDVPPYAIVGGNPAKIISYRFEKDAIEKLLKINWWDWDENKILENINLISSANVELFIRNNIIEK